MTDLNELFKVIAEGKKHYEETDPVGKKIKEAKEHVKEDLSGLFAQLVSLKEDLEKELVAEETKLVSLIDEDKLKQDAKNIVNEVFGQIKKPIITEEIPAQPIIHTPEVRASQVDADVDKYLTDKSFQQPNPDLVSKNIDDIRNKIKFLEQAIGRVAAAGPGGGEVNLRWLDDVDRSTINDGWYLRYSETKKKFEFAEVQASGGNGATGAAGPAGATGPQGASGVAGATGPQGIDGASGADSTVPGATGETGATGSQGDIGATGIQGEPGATGVDGASGINGLDGATGVQGASGVNGSTGPTGATGLQGDRYQTTSNTTQTIANSGQLTFYTNDLGLAYSAQQTVIVVDGGTNHMHGTVVSYDKVTGELVLDINSKQGTGTYSFWTINLDGAVGAIGASGINGATGATGVQGASGVGATGLTGATGAQGSPGSGGTIANWGAFYDLNDQVAGALNTGQPFLLRSTDPDSTGVSVVNNSEVTVANAGTYDIQFSVQLHNTGGGGDGTQVLIWLRKNGTDVPDTSTQIDVLPAMKFAVPAWNFVLKLNAGDNVQLMWQTDNLNIVSEYNVASTSPAYPAIPSVILTVTQVTYTQVGPTGATGATGIQGASGATGTQGASGVQGASGIQGASGSTGIQGASGVNGASGTIGVNGASGVQGASGIQGASGSTGLTGATGPAVTLASLNYAQTLGASGFSGATGATGVVFSAAAFTGNGSPIEVTVYGDANPLVAGTWVRLQLYRDSTPIGTPIQAESSAANENIPYSLHVIDNPGAGTFTYALRCTASAGGGFQFGEAGTGTFTVKELSNVRGATGAQGIQGASGAGPAFVAGYVNAGSFVTMDNVKATVPTSGNRGLSLATVSGSFTALYSGTYGLAGGGGGYAGGSTITTTPSASLFGWGFPGAGDGSTYLINDTTNSRFYRINLSIGAGYLNNFISIERLY